MEGFHTLVSLKSHFGRAEAVVAQQVLCEKGRGMVDGRRSPRGHQWKEGPDGIQKKGSGVRLISHPIVSKCLKGYKALHIIIDSSSIY